MTLLRRTAQLVQDLRTLNVIKEYDYLEFHQGDKGLCLRIVFSDRNTSDTAKIDAKSIEQAIREEFSENHFNMLNVKESGVLCQFEPKE